MNIIAVDDEKLALDTLVDSIEKSVAEARVHGFRNPNSIAIDRESVDCDYYDFLRHIPYAVNSYHGQYMMQYSWAEITTAVLLQLK